MITIRGMHLLEKADVIIYAGSLVNPKLLDYAKADCQVYNSAVMTLEEVLAVMVEAEQKGKDVVRLHAGEPSIYGAVQEQMQELDAKKIAYDSTPGVSACFGAAAAMDPEYTPAGYFPVPYHYHQNGGTDGVPRKKALRHLLPISVSMAIYLSTGMLEKLSERLIKGGYSKDTTAALAYKVSWPEGRNIYLHGRNIGTDSGRTWNYQNGTGSRWRCH